MNLPYPVVLASGSPRRKELLGSIVGEFEILVSNVDEDALTVPDPWETAKALAWAKTAAVSEELVRVGATGRVILGADTVVALPEGEGFVQLAKPTDAEDAVGMLMRLSGKRHAVITGVAMISPFVSSSSADTAWVTFRDLSELEVREYVATGEPMDKAGSYAIQGGARGFVATLEGDVETVIGLPISIVKQLFAEVK